MPGKYKSEEITLYGVDPDSKYIRADLSGEGVYISSAYADKFRIKEGDIITLKEKYESMIMWQAFVYLWKEIN